jgi:hypothetical protein
MLLFCNLYMHSWNILGGIIFLISFNPSSLKLDPAHQIASTSVCDRDLIDTQEVTFLKLLVLFILQLSPSLLLATSPAL